MTKDKDTLTGFMIVVLALSLVNILSRMDGISILLIIHTAIGASAFGLYFAKNRFYKLLTFIWLFSQLVVVTKTIFDPASGLKIQSAIWDLRLKYHAQFGLKIDGLGIDLDVLTLVLLVIFMRTLKKADQAEENLPIEAESA